MTTLSTAELNSLANKFGTDGGYAALFTADPGLSGSVTGEVSGGSPAYARKAITWATASGGITTGTVTFDVPAATTVTFAAVCSASTGANLIAKNSVTTQVFASQGQYTLTLTFTES